MAQSMLFNQDSYPDLIKVANRLAELENRTPPNAIDTLVKECGPAKIERLKAEKKAREG